tara:strand:- start:1007 stop:1783 length:777 start_codon:yes stop_codon:yes gene_type:complete
MDESLFSANSFSKLHNGKTIIFCKTDYIVEELKIISDIKEDVTLITANSDYSIDENIVDLAPPNITRWFAQNANSSRIIGIPLGMENNAECKRDGHGVVWDWAEGKIQKIKQAGDPEPSKNVYANFSIQTNPQERFTVYEKIKDLEYVTNDVIFNYQENLNRDYSNYVEKILEHKMSICPAGNGADCHRVWEVLYLNRVPIVKKSTIMNHFKDLPIIFVDNWDDLELEYLLDQYKKVKQNGREKLRFEYWEEKIKERT